MSNYTEYFLQHYRQDYLIGLKGRIKLDTIFIDLLEAAKDAIAKYNGKEDISTIFELEACLFGNKELYDECFFTISKFFMGHLRRPDNIRCFRIVLAGRLIELHDDNGDFVKNLSDHIIEIPLVLTDQKRIDFDKTNDNIDKMIQERKKSIQYNTDIVEHFDQYCELSKDIEMQIEQYKKKVPEAISLGIKVNGLSFHF